MGMSPALITPFDWCRHAVRCRVPALARIRPQSFQGHIGIS
jgi:hypothetical protein